MTLLQRGQYAEGWGHYAARFEVLPKREPPPGMAEWRGESLAGKRLLVIAEQGLGDQILLSRLVGMTGADEVALTVARPLVRMLSGLGAEVSNPQVWDGVTADAWTYLGQIPCWLELGPADAPAPYLPCEPGPASGVGPMLEGAPRNRNNAHRLPGPLVARAIRGLADFVDLSPRGQRRAGFRRHRPHRLQPQAGRDRGYLRRTPGRRHGQAHLGDDAGAGDRLVGQLA
jgi:hypothetical protein